LPCLRCCKVLANEKVAVRLGTGRLPRSLCRGVGGVSRLNPTIFDPGPNPDPVGGPGHSKLAAGSGNALHSRVRA